MQWTMNTLVRLQRWLAGFSLLTDLKWTWIILFKKKKKYYICRKGSYFPNSTRLQGSEVIVNGVCRRADVLDTALYDCPNGTKPLELFPS